MGNSTSSHEPLERGFTRGTFGDVKNTVGIISFCCDWCILFTFILIPSFEFNITNLYHCHKFSPQKSASFRHSKRSPKKMDRLRKSFRDSFRRRKDRVPEAAKPHQWQADEQAVRSATCTFPVKYLGCVEVFESRGMQVCEEALKVLRVSLQWRSY